MIKKILAVTLALMSAFVGVNAEPIKKEESPASFTSSKDEKSKHKLWVKILTVGAAVSLGGVFGVLKLLDKSGKNNSECEEEHYVVNNIPDMVFCYYSIPEIKECIEKFIPRTEEEKSLQTDFIYLFHVLDRTEIADAQRIEKALCHIEYQTYYIMPCENGLMQAIVDVSATYVYSGKFSNQVGYNMSSVSADNNTLVFRLGKNNCNPCFPFNKKCTHCLKNFEKIYELTAIIVYNECNLLCVSLYMNYDKNGYWQRYSFGDDNREIISEKEIGSKFQRDTQYMDLIYTKKV